MKSYALLMMMSLYMKNILTKDFCETERSVEPHNELGLSAQASLGIHSLPQTPFYTTRIPLLHKKAPSLS